MYIDEHPIYVQYTTSVSTNRSLQTMSRFMSEEISRETSIFGLSPWVVLGISIGAAFVLLLFLLSLCLTSKRANPKPNQSTQSTIPIVSRDIQVIRVDHPNQNRVQPDPSQDSSGHRSTEQALLLKPDEEGPIGHPRIHIEIGKGHRILYPERFVRSGSHGEVRLSGDHHHHHRVVGSSGGAVGPQVSHLGWGHWYTLRELEDATNGFADENVIGEGGYGIVYHGVLVDNTQVAVKNLLNIRGQAEKEFEVEVEAIGRVRHKNLVRLLGYCAEGAHRILVYEYVNNGNLEQWLHGDVGSCSPLAWDIRMNIILGMAKGLAYLHEGLEPKVVHRDIKSSNILLDKLWNPKVSDFGLAKLIGAERSYITTRVMGTFGYVSPEYASTGMLNERSDTYSFGILIMELITGRNPVDYSRPQEEVNLVNWLKKMVTDQNSDGVLDPRLPENPSSRALKRALLIALRCIDPVAQKRPKMGYVVRMLEAKEQSPFIERSAGRDRRANNDMPEDGSAEKPLTNSDNNNIECHIKVQDDGDR